MKISESERPASGSTIEVTATAPSAVKPRPLRLLAPATWLRLRKDLQPVRKDTAEQPKQRRRVSLHMITFITIVVIPSLAILGYLAFIASDQYIAVSRFAVRSAAFEQPIELPSSGSATTRSANLPMVVGQDAYIVVAYIRSHKILADISSQVDVRSIYRHPAADFWERLPDKASAEDLLEYWNKRVQASVDGPSGIVTVRVRAFTPEDAVRVLNAVVSASEQLANDVSARARRDTVQRAEEEVNRAMAGAQATLMDLQKFRERVGFIDPVSSATMTNSLILQLLAEKIKSENELYVMQRVSPDNAIGQRVLRTTIDSIQQQIDRLKEALTGHTEGNRSVAAALVEYERLEMQRLLSQKLLTMAQEALQRAAQRVDRQNIYVTTFVSASLPEDSEYPKRFQFFIMAILLIVSAWGVLTLLISTIDDHRI